MITNQYTIHRRAESFITFLGELRSEVPSALFSLSPQTPTSVSIHKQEMFN